MQLLVTFSHKQQLPHNVLFLFVCLNATGPWYRRADDDLHEDRMEIVTSMRHYFGKAKSEGFEYINLAGAWGSVYKLLLAAAGL